MRSRGGLIVGDLINRYRVTPLVSRSGYQKSKVVFFSAPAGYVCSGTNVHKCIDSVMANSYLDLNPIDTPCILKPLQQH